MNHSKDYCPDSKCADFLTIVPEFKTYKLDFFAEAEGLESESLSVSYILSHDTLVDVGLGHVPSVADGVVAADRATHTRGRQGLGPAGGVPSASKGNVGAAARGL